MVLTAPRPPGTVRVTQQVDGKWRLVEHAGTDPLRIPITGFSPLRTSIVGVLDEPASIDGPATSGDAPAHFLQEASSPLARS